MERWLPVGYFSVLVLEAVVLGAYYAIAQPAGGSLFNIVVGSVGLLSMILMLVYSIARRSKALREVARLSAWLHLHIFLGVQGVIFVVLHSSPLLYREGGYGVLNPGLLNLVAVTVVFGSGIFGRYLFAQVPKTIGGQHLALKDLDQELQTLQVTVPPVVEQLWRDAPGAKSITDIPRAQRARRKALQALDSQPLEPEVKRLATRKLLLEHQKASLTAALPLFRRWLVLHRPIALMMYVLSAVHVVLSIAFSPVLGGS